MSKNYYVNIDEKLLEAFSKVPNVILDNSIYNSFKEYFDEHPNFIFKQADEVLPEEYRYNVLFKLNMEARIP